MRVPKYRLHKGTGQALVEISGRRIYLGKYGTPKSRERYRKEIANLLLSKGPKPTRKPEPIEFLVIGDLINRFMAWAAAYYRDSETGLVTNEFEMLKLAAGPLLHVHIATPIADFGPVQLKEVREEMVRRGWTRKHINHQVQRLRRVFRWGVDHEIVPPATLEALRAVAPLKRGRTAGEERDAVRPASDDEVEAAIPFLSPHVAAMVRLQRATGMRSQNICRMRAGDIDRTEEVSAGVWILRPDRHKMSHADRSLEIFLGPAAQAILLPIIGRRRSEEYVFSPEDSLREHRERWRAARKTKVPPSQAARTVKFPESRPGKKFTTRSYRRAIQRAIDRYNEQPAAGAPAIEKWSPHRLRHARGTEVRRRYGLEAAQVALGHAKAYVTEIYAKADLELAAKVAREIG